MNKIIQKLISFMYGRYGIDEMYYGVFGLVVILSIVNIFVGSPILTAITTAGMVVVVFRMLSKNHAKRRAENRIFLKIWNPIKNYITYTRDRIRDRNNFRYRKCPECRAIIKLPNKKGKHTTTCPRCHKKFDVRIL